MARDKMAEVLAMGINLLNGRDSVHLTVTQVASIANAYRDATGEPAFTHPNYSISLYVGGRDGWELSRFPNKAGLIKRIKDADVQASVAKRELDRRIEEMCRGINAKFLMVIEASRDPLTDDEYMAAVNEYREFCKANGLNK